MVLALLTGLFNMNTQDHEMTLVAQTHAWREGSNWRQAAPVRGKAEMWKGWSFLGAWFYRRVKG